MKDLIKYSYRYGVYISSYDLAKATNKKHQNLMATVKRNYKYYIHYYTQDHKYYKNQKVYILTPRIIQAINKKGIYNDLLEELKKEQQKRSEKIQKEIEMFFKVLPQ